MSHRESRRVQLERALEACTPAELRYVEDRLFELVESMPGDAPANSQSVMHWLALYVSGESTDQAGRLRRLGFGVDKADLTESETVIERAVRRYDEEHRDD